MLSEKSPDEKLDDNNQKRLQNFIQNFLYFNKTVDPKILMALNSLAAV